MDINRIAIIGGGPTSLSVIKNFLQDYSNLNKDIVIDIYEPNQLGIGLVYSESELETSRQSFSSDKMIVFPESPLLYSNWRKNKTEIEDNNNYPSRKLMGMFLSDLTEEILTNAKKKNIEINHIKKLVINVEYLDNKYQLYTDKESQMYNAIFLCIGNLAPQAFSYLESHPAYIHEIWGNNNFSQHSKDLDKILVIGSGLTSIDVLLGLRKYGYSNKVIFASRNALLPRIRGEDKKYILNKKITKPTNLKSFIKYSSQFLEELAIENNYPKKLLMKQPVSYSNFKLELEYVKKNNFNPLYSFALSLEENLENLWSSFDLEEKKYLDKHYTAFFNSIHLPMILETAQQLNQDFINQTLEIKQLQTINTKNDLLTAIYKDTNSKLDTEDFRLIINATGRGLNIEKMDNILIKNLLNSKLIISHPLGGIKVNKYNESNNNFFIIGPLTRGQHFFTYILRENGRKANEAVNYYIKNNL